MGYIKIKVDGEYCGGCPCLDDDDSYEFCWVFKKHLHWQRKNSQTGFGFVRCKACKDAEVKEGG